MLFLRPKRLACLRAGMAQPLCIGHTSHSVRIQDVVRLSNNRMVQIAVIRVMPVHIGTRVSHASMQQQDIYWAASWGVQEGCAVFRPAM